jgi:hypothetical protein
MTLEHYRCLGPCSPFGPAHRMPPMRRTAVLLILTPLWAAAGLAQTPTCNPCVDGPGSLGQPVRRVRAEPAPDRDPDNNPLTPRDIKRRTEDALSRSSAPDEASGICPRTDFSRWPTFHLESSDATLYGTRDFAAQIRSDTTSDTGAYLVHWYRAGPVADPAGDFDVTIRRLDGGAATATDSPVPDEKPDGRWHALKGMAFPDDGCWEVTGSYQGRRLSFVIGTFRARDE